MLGSVALIGDIYQGSRRLSVFVAASLQVPRALKSPLVSPVWISAGCRGNAALWYFTPNLNQWSLYLTMPGNYLGSLARTCELLQNQKAGSEWRGFGGAERESYLDIRWNLDNISRKKKTGVQKQTKLICICLHALYSAGIVSKRFCFASRVC